VRLEGSAADDATVDTCGEGCPVVVERAVDRQLGITQQLQD
jgi:hypothetical protein